MLCLKKIICTGWLHPEVRALTFLYSLFDRKDTLMYTFWYSFCILKLNAFNERHFFKYLDDRFPYPFVDFDSLNPYPFIYMKRVTHLIYKTVRLSLCNSQIHRYQYLPQAHGGCPFHKQCFFFLFVNFVCVCNCLIYLRVIPIYY